MNKKTVFSLFAALLASSLCAGDFVLAKDGTTQCNLVVAKDAAPPLSFGAKELSSFTEKVSSAKIPVSSEPVKGANNIFVGTIADKKLLEKSGIDAKVFKEDGFALVVKENELYIVGENPRGALYGCYEILKKYAGVRFLTPVAKEDGTYFFPKKTIRIPEQKTIRNPYLRGRSFQCGAQLSGTPDIYGATFLVRNNLYGAAGPGVFLDKNGKRAKTADAFESVAVKKHSTSGNSHIFTYLMAGGTWNGKKTLEKLYKEHPEYFPLVDGKRVFIAGGTSPNPCVSNPGLLDLMAENLYAKVKDNYVPEEEEYITIGNNDTPIWCQCENCKKLDDPAKAGTKDANGDRYWYTVSEIAKRIWKKNPSVKLAGWAYFFCNPPTRLKLDPRLRVIISFNNQCWKHTITDKNCPINREFLKILEAWKKTGHPYVINRDEIGTGGSVGGNFLPAERILYENLKSYPSLGLDGTYFCIWSPQPPYYSWMKNTPPYFGKNLYYLAMWQTSYLSAQFLWDIHQDFDALYEEANSLYYGKAWEGGYKEFRKLQTRYFVESPGCMGWGQGAPLGKLLDPAGSEEKLAELMDKAVEAAKQDKDHRSLKHILEAKEIFELTWRKARKEYLSNFREINVYKRTAPIVIDGVLEEKDWKNADTLANFKPGGHTKKTAKVEPTGVKICYDEDHLYIAVEAMEPHPDQLIAGKEVNGIWGKLGDHIELFYSFPDMAEKYFHLAINPYGEVIAALQHSFAKRKEFQTKAKFATKILKDRWVLEIAIPASEIGMKCYSGATWKLNVARGRKNHTITTGYKTSPNVEHSSCSNGAFHGSANFVNLKFTEKRIQGVAQGADPAGWKNASFNVLVPDSKIIKYARYNRNGTWKFEDEKQLVPQFWTVGEKSVGMTKWHKDNPQDSYIQLEKGYISQYFIAPGKGRIKITFRAKGKGRAQLWVGSYTDSKTGKGYHHLVKTTKTLMVDLTDDWKSYVLETEKTGVPTERVAVRFFVGKESVLDLDDVYVIPLPPQEEKGK
ncbi:MAG: DUF4838 domain-containing protein [Lentisphaeria bacterium]|nr:DUF4838 domain-containing protein [Lentisphaeria bacterium]